MGYFKTNEPCFCAEPHISEPLSSTARGSGLRGCYRRTPGQHSAARRPAAPPAGPLGPGRASPATRRPLGLAPPARPRPAPRSLTAPWCRRAAAGSSAGPARAAGAAGCSPAGRGGTSRARRRARRRRPAPTAPSGGAAAAPRGRPRRPAPLPASPAQRGAARTARPAPRRATPPPRHVTTSACGRRGAGLRRGAAERAWLTNAPPPEILGSRPRAHQNHAHNHTRPRPPVRIRPRPLARRAARLPVAVLRSFPPRAARPSPRLRRSGRPRAPESSTERLSADKAEGPALGSTNASHRDLHA